MKKAIRFTKIIVITCTLLFVGTQVCAVISYALMDEAEKCVARRHIERNERPWEETYWNSDEMLERACSVYQYSRRD